MDKAKIGLFATAGAALFILIATVTNSWFSDSTKMGKTEISVGVGLWSVKMCTPDCQTKTMEADEMKDDASFAYVGKLTFFVGLATAGLLGFLAFCGFTQKKELLGKFGKFGLIAASLFLVLTIAFLVTKPDVLPGVGFSFILGFFGAIAGIVGSKFLKAA